MTSSCRCSAASIATPIPWRWCPPWSPRWPRSIMAPRISVTRPHRELFARRIIAKLPDHRGRRLQAHARPGTDSSRGGSRLLREPAPPVVCESVGALCRSIPWLPKRSSCCSFCMPITSRTPARPPCAWPEAPARTRMRRFPPEFRRSGDRRMAAPMRRCSTCWSRSARSRKSISFWLGSRTNPTTCD